MSEQARLRRRPRVDGLTRFYHPHGWSIRQCKRDWTLDGFPRGALGGTALDAPLYWYEVRPDATRTSRGGYPKTFDKLREARAWCDANTREAPRV